MSDGTVQILLVEDSPSDADLITRFFEDAGLSASIVVSRTVEAALGELKSQTPDIVICEYRLPDGDAMALLPGDLRAGRYPVLVMTSQGDERVAVDVMKAGAIDYVVKGTELFATMPRICERIMREWHLIQNGLRLERRLQEAQRMETIGRLTGSIAHDFNNILTPILMTSHMLVKELEAGSGSHRRAKRVLSASKRAKELVSRILELGRQSEPELRPVLMHEVVADTLELLRESMPPTLEIRLRLNAPQGHVMADETQMHQVLMNLCTNAYQAIGDASGVLDICVEEVALDADSAFMKTGLREGRYVCIDVRDTGTGMDAATIEQIFDAFYTTKAPGQGTGLGLAVVKSIINRHDGAITVESQPGQGATFRVFLPMTENIEATDGHGPGMEGGDERILLVDDDTEVAQSMAELLESAGYRVSVESSGSDALRAFQEDPLSFDVILTDQVMPAYSASDFASQVLSIRADIPIIVSSGFGDSLNADNFREYGFSEILNKPVEPEELDRTLRRVIEASKRGEDA